MNYSIVLDKSFAKEVKRLSKPFTVVVALDLTEINLLYIYDKADRDTITKAELEELLRINLHT